MLPLVQPVLEVGCVWPLGIVFAEKAYVLVTGNNELNIIAGEKEAENWPPLDALPVYPPINKRWHERFMHARVSLSDAHAIDVSYVCDLGEILILTSPSATAHFFHFDPTIYIGFPNFLQFKVLSGVAAETASLLTIGWHSPDSQPLPSGILS